MNCFRPQPEIPELGIDAKRALLPFLNTVQRESEGRASSLSEGVGGNLPQVLVLKLLGKPMRQFIPPFSNAYLYSLSP